MPDPSATPNHGSLRDARRGHHREVNAQGAGIVSKGEASPLAAEQQVPVQGRGRISAARRGFCEIRACKRLIAALFRALHN